VEETVTDDEKPGDGHELNDLRANPEPRSVAKYYDTWAENYDQDVSDWEYNAPVAAAAKLNELVPLDAAVLDAGCGTGLVGKALKSLGFNHVMGIDISAKSLELAAQTDAYEQLTRVDMQKLPLPCKADAFAALLSVGVLTYVPETDAILREFCRVVRPGGIVVFTQRTDLFEQRDCAAILQNLEEEGVWQRISVSSPQPYLPGEKEFADKIKVIYCVFRVA
jgi:predicted TPR repeat methyltransferase